MSPVLITVRRVHFPANPDVRASCAPVAGMVSAPQDALRRAVLAMRRPAGYCTNTCSIK
jgi:hypothetical protein